MNIFSRIVSDDVIWNKWWVFGMHMNPLIFGQDPAVSDLCIAFWSCFCSESRNIRHLIAAKYRWIFGVSKGWHFHGTGGTGKLGFHRDTAILCAERNVIAFDELHEDEDFEAFNFFKTNLFPHEWSIWDDVWSAKSCEVAYKYHHLTYPSQHIITATEAFQSCLVVHQH